MDFKDKLKQLRKDSGLSQQALADGIHISRSAIAKWENGLGLPSQDAMEALNRYFDLPADYFESGGQEPAAERSGDCADSGFAWSGLWNRFCNRYTIVSGCLLLLFGLFCLLTQWKMITLPMDGVSVEWIYMLSDGRYVYKLEDVSEDVYCSQWKFIYTDEGCVYQIPRRSVIELGRKEQPNQLLCEMMGDPNENNAAHDVLGLPHITKWYIGKPGDAVLIYEEGMDIAPAPEKLLIRWGYKDMEEPAR